MALEELINRLGYLDELGITATTINVADSAKIISGIVGGNIDICMYAGFGQVLPAVEQGAKLKLLAGACTLAPVSLFSGNPDIKTLKDLEGKDDRNWIGWRRSVPDHGCAAAEERHRSQQDSFR